MNTLIMNNQKYQIEIKRNALKSAGVIGQDFIKNY